MNRYFDLIDQTFYFPTNEFRVEEDHLYFNGVDIMDLIEKYGTPLRITYLPKISQKIQFAKRMFNLAINKLGYQGKYVYCYCTKANHFKFVLEKALENDIQLETSSAFDIDIIRSLYRNNKVTKDLLVVCNGFKPVTYLNEISNLINEGFHNCTPIIDHTHEIDHYTEKVEGNFKVGIRVAADEEPNFGFYTSRLGMRYNDVLNFYREKIANNEKVELTMLHFFINTGIRDTQYYWFELRRFLDTYCELKKICPTLNAVDIGGGFPIVKTLGFEYNFEYMAEAIVQNIQFKCKEAGVDVPNIMTEFGTFTVGESGAIIYSVIDQKLQNDKELWYMIDGSLITQVPDTWATNTKFVLLAVNNWQKEYQKVHLGGLTCDSDDYYNSEAHSSIIYMPKLQEDKPQYLGFFHMGAYQENLSGYGGLQHCLIPHPKHLVLDIDENGKLTETLFAEEQSKHQMLNLLGFQ